MLVAALLGAADAADVVGRGTGVDDRRWMRKRGRRDAALGGPRPHRGDPVGLLRASAVRTSPRRRLPASRPPARRTPVVLDGVVSGAGALVAERIAPGAPRVVGRRSPVHRARAPPRADRSASSPSLDFGMRLGEGTGALVALPVLRAAPAPAAEMATFAEITGTAVSVGDACASPSGP